jgi:hypothetical protein
MTKRLFHIGFVVSTILAAFFLGTHFVDSKKDTEKLVKELVAKAIYAEQRDNKPIVIMYKKEQDKEYQAAKIDTMEKRTVGFSSTIKRSNVYDPKSGVDYLIKWDETKEWFTSENPNFLIRHECYDLFLADISM